MYVPFEDPRRLLEGRLGNLEIQLSDMGLGSDLALEKAILDSLALQFRNNEIKPEAVCFEAMKTYWKNTMEIHGTKVGHNLANLGHDFGEASNVDFADLEGMWTRAQASI